MRLCVPPRLGQLRRCGIVARRAGQTLTVTRSGVTGSLLKTVMGTNPVESMIEILRDHSRNVYPSSPATCACPGRPPARSKPPSSSVESAATGGYPPSPPSQTPSTPINPTWLSQAERLIPNQRPSPKFYDERDILLRLLDRTTQSLANLSHDWPGAPGSVGSQFAPGATFGASWHYWLCVNHLLTGTEPPGASQSHNPLCAWRRTGMPRILCRSAIFVVRAIPSLIANVRCVSRKV